MDFFKKRRIVILTAGKLDIFSAKTAVGLLRYRSDEVIGLLNPHHAGQRLEKILGIGEGIPVVSEIEELASKNPDTLVIGIAPPGGKMPELWRWYIREAIEQGMDVVNGLHTMLNEDPELLSLANAHGVTLWDLREPPKQTHLGKAAAASIPAKTVLTIGSDCNVGKKISAIEITQACQRRGHDAVLIPTGQTGVMIFGRGMVIDRVISDFVPGAVENMILQEKEHDWIFIEGQGALYHPSYSAVTMGLLHGACPKAMILCHQPSRKHLRHTKIPIPPLDEIINAHKTLLNPFLSSEVVGISLNCFDLSDKEVKAEVKRIENEMNLPTTDVIRLGPEPLMDALETFFETSSYSPTQ